MQTVKERFINSVNLNIHTDFPYLVLDAVNDHSYPRNPGFQVMHWHEDLQLIYVQKGTITIQTLDPIVEVCQGEAIFINQDVVHTVKRLGECHYNSFIFPAYFLTFYPGSPVKDLVDSVITNEQLPLFHFTAIDGWQKEILSILQQLAELEQNKTTFYAYEVLVRLCTLWLILRKNITIPPERKESAVHLRMQKIFRYIETHYAEDLSLADLAKSANISKSECSRCFQASLHTTPYQYLTEYRLAKAAQLLKHTNEPIGNIAASVGFHQMSHFGKRFKEKTGYSPRAYREIESRP